LSACTSMKMLRPTLTANPTPGRSNRADSPAYTFKSEARASGRRCHSW
jgi:hypothetical protein